MTSSTIEILQTQTERIKREATWTETETANNSANEADIFLSQCEIFSGCP